MRETSRLNEEALLLPRKKDISKPKLKAEQARGQERRSKLITSEQTAAVSGEINNKYELNELKSVEDDRRRAKELRAEEAQAAYVQAYRAYDPQFTKNKIDDLIAVTRPPFLALSSAAKELKRLHGVMVKARENVISEDE